MPELKNKTLSEISQDDRLGSKFHDFAHEFGKMINNSNFEKQKKYFSQYPILLQDFRLGPDVLKASKKVPEVAIRYESHFKKGEDDRHVIANLDRFYQNDEELFKNLFAEYLALKKR